MSTKINYWWVVMQFDNFIKKQLDYNIPDLPTQFFLCRLLITNPDKFQRKGLKYS